MSDFQKRSGDEGRRFEDLCARILRGSGFAIIAEHSPIVNLGADVDFVVRNQHGVEFWIECKGGRGNRPGAQRTDNIRKAVTVGALARLANVDAPRLIVLTTRSAKAGLRSDLMIAAAKALGAIHDVIAIEEDENDLARLDALAEVAS